MEAEVPEDDTDAYRHIQRVLRTELRDFKAEVGGIYDILTDAGHLVAEYHGITLSRFWNELVQHHGTDRLLCTHDRIPFLLETTDRVHGVVDMFPCDTVLGTEGRFMDFGRWRNGTDSAKPYLVDLE